MKLAVNMSVINPLLNKSTEAVVHSLCPTEDQHLDLNYSEGFFFFLFKCSA